MLQEGSRGVEGDLEHGASAAVEVETGRFRPAGVPPDVPPRVDEGRQVRLAPAERFHDLLGFFHLPETLKASTAIFYSKTGGEGE